jgi:hypothetical protein
LSNYFELKHGRFLKLRRIKRFEWIVILLVLSFFFQCMPKAFFFWKFWLMVLVIKMYQCLNQKHWSESFNYTNTLVMNKVKWFICIFFSHKYNIIKYNSSFIIGNNWMKLLGKKNLILGIKHQHYSNWKWCSYIHKVQQCIQC